MYKGCIISYVNFGGASRRRFSLFAKNISGAATTPLAGRGLTTQWVHNISVEPAQGVENHGLRSFSMDFLTLLLSFPQIKKIKRYSPRGLEPGVPKNAKERDVSGRYLGRFLSK